MSLAIYHHVVMSVFAYFYSTILIWSSFQLVVPPVGFPANHSTEKFIITIVRITATIPTMTTTITSFS